MKIDEMIGYLEWRKSEEEAIRRRLEFSRAHGRPAERSDYPALTLVEYAADLARRPAEGDYARWWCLAREFREQALADVLGQAAAGSAATENKP